MWLLLLLIASTTPIVMVNSNGAQVNPDDLFGSKNCPMCGGLNMATLLSTTTEKKIFPSRSFHANGGGAHGHFVVTHNITQYTKAVLFSEIGKKTQILARFSTNYGEAGSADIPVLPPDVRGFAVKFYTEAGNMDFVGSNCPVPPIREPALFTKLDFSRSRHPRSHVPDPNLWWNFTSSHPQTMMQTVQMFSYLAYPAGWRQMDGMFPHAFKLVNAESKVVYAKFHFLADEKEEGGKVGKYFRYEQASNLNLVHMDYAKEDLYRAIKTGQFPSWTMYIQVMTFKQARKSKINPFDPTKLWSQSLYPLLPVGKMTLTANLRDYFSEIEVAAFSPGCLIPGIEQSPDPILNARAFAYPVAHRMRLGPSFLDITVNTMKGVKSAHERRKIRLRWTKPHPDVKWRKVWNQPDDLEQPRQFYDQLSDGEKGQLAANIVTWLGLANHDIQRMTVNAFQNVSAKLARDIEDALVRSNEV